MKLLIAIPTLDYVHSEFMKCLTRLVIRLKNDGVDFDVDIVSGTLVYSAREKLARKAINQGYTHTLWLDSDMVFTEDLLDDLMFSGKSFVSGIYHARRTPHPSVIFKSIKLDELERYTDNYPKTTFQIAGCGFGCVLIETEIMRTVMLDMGHCFLPVDGLGEDLAFCQRATARGFKIWCEPAVRLGHIGHLTVYPEDYTRYRENNNIEV